MNSDCPLCDSKSIETRYDMTRKYKYNKEIHVLLGLEHSVCTKCGCDFFADGQIERNNEKVLELETSLISKTMITAQRKQELKAAGYYIEDMGKEYGPVFIGKYRWMKYNSNDFQDGTSTSEYDAWVEASNYHYALTY